MLLNLIDHLPRNSYFVQAITNDEEHARLLNQARERAEAEGKPIPKGPAMAWWSEEAEQLAGVKDLLQSLITVTILAAGAKKAPKPTPTPRPSTILEEVKQKDRWNAHKALVSRVLPNKQE